MLDDERSSGERDTAAATWKYSLGLIHRIQQQQQQRRRHVGVGVGFGFGGVGFGDDDAREDDETDDDGAGDARGSRAWGVDRDVCERQAASVGERER